MSPEQTVAERIRAIRQDNGQRLADVADATGICVASLSRIELGQKRLRVDDVFVIAEALGVYPADLFGFTDDLVRRERTVAVAVAALADVRAAIDFALEDEL